MLALSACTDDFLTRYPHGAWHDGNMTPDDGSSSLLIESELTSAYRDLGDWNNLWPVFAMHNIITPEAEKGGTPTDGAGDFSPFSDMSFTPSSGLISGFYSRCYGTITTVNRVLVLIQALPDSNPDKNRYQAEAFFLRGLMYYRLTQAFGDVSYVDRVMDQTEEVVPRSPRETVREKYVKELEWAIPHLMTRKQAVEKGVFRVITQNAARAVIAKTYLYQKNWAMAQNYAAQIIVSGDNDLSTAFADVFKEKFEFGPESILEANAEIDRERQLILESPAGRMQGWRGLPNLGWGFHAPSEALRNAFEPGDPRKKVTVIAPGDDLEGETAMPGEGSYGYCNGKAYVCKAEFAIKSRTLEDQGTWYNPRIIRYSDILLLYAEACCELGGEDNISEALAKLEMVRKRARGSNTSVLPEVKTRDQNELREKIRFERKIELAMEFEHYFDLVRWDVAKDLISGFEVGKHELFPIPQTEVDRGIGQNPLY